MAYVDTYWRDMAEQAEERVSAACFAVGAISFLLREDTGYTRAERLDRIAERVETLRQELNLTKPIAKKGGQR